MFAPQHKTSGTRPKKRIHGAFVIASWGIAAGWIAFEITLPPHRTEDLLWRASVALGLVAASSCMLVIWCLVRALIEPINSERAAFRIGYQAGRHDAASAKQARVYLLPQQRADDDRTGTR
jgi:hypothetical protein